MHSLLDLNYYEAFGKNCKANECAEQHESSSKHRATGKVSLEELKYYFRLRNDGATCTKVKAVTLSRYALQL